MNTKYINLLRLTSDLIPKLVYEDKVVILDVLFNSNYIAVLNGEKRVELFDTLSLNAISIAIEQIMRSNQDCNLNRTINRLLNNND